MAFLGKLFGGGKTAERQEQKVTTSVAIQKLRDTEEMLKKRTVKAETAIDFESQEHAKLIDFHSQVDEMLAVGTATMGKLRDQRDTFSRIKSSLSEIANQLGMSNTVMRLIEKRSAMDNLILYGLMIIFIIFMIIVYIYFVR
uniref:t-SNARE coiled-coil homology domain-containing protein n=1 Tax=Tetranychus urticae TaxID=32264 RepID=T1K8N5_TETUR